MSWKRSALASQSMQWQTWWICLCCLFHRLAEMTFRLVRREQLLIFVLQSFTNCRHNETLGKRFLPCTISCSFSCTISKIPIKLFYDDPSTARRPVGFCAQQHTLSMQPADNCSDYKPYLPTHNISEAVMALQMTISVCFCSVFLFVCFLA